MAQKHFEAAGWMRMANRLMAGMVKLGITPNATILLTVPGRKTGAPRTTVVSMLEMDGRRYITSPYGNVDWTRNLRAAGKATLRRGRRVEEVRAIELSPTEAAPVLQRALQKAPQYVRSFFDVTADSPLDAIAAEAPRHPVFGIMPVAALAAAS